MSSLMGFIPCSCSLVMRYSLGFILWGGCLEDLEDFLFEVWVAVVYGVGGVVVWVVVGVNDYLVVFDVLVDADVGAV